MTSRKETIQYYYKLLFWGAAFMLVFCFVSYGYFLNKTVHNVVGRQQAGREIAQLGSDVGELESKYITLKDAITLDLAYSLGFQSVTNPVFISRTALSKSLSINTIE